jgi:hypothetical protein
MIAAPAIAHCGVRSASDDGENAGDEPAHTIDERTPGAAFRAAGQMRLGRGLTPRRQLPIDRQHEIAIAQMIVMIAHRLLLVGRSLAGDRPHQ